MSRPRLHDSGFLRFLHTKPCCLCGASPVEAAHIRIGFRALGKKPDDRYATPLCREHHEEQHGMNEAQFWTLYQRNPFDIAAKLYAEYGGTGGKPKPKRAPRPRPPKERRAKIPSRPFPKRKKVIP